MSHHYTIWIVSPPGYAHSRVFDEVALGLQQAFHSLGFDAPVVTDPARIQDRAVVLGANLLPRLPPTLPPNLILYNLELVQSNSAWFQPGYVELLRRYPVWDYNPRNLETLRQNFGIEGVLCGIGYMPALSRILPAAEDFEVLFYGSMNGRRQAVLDEIERRGLNVTTAFGSYGEARDALIARAKLVLSVHFDAARQFEIVRVSYLLANRKCVVAETSFDDPLQAPFQEAIAFAPYAALAETCLHLVKNRPQREALAARGFACFSAMSQTPMLERALASMPE